MEKESAQESQMSNCLDEPHIALRIVSKSLNYTGYLIDISRNGLAVLVKRELKEGVPVKNGFFMGKYKLISKGIVRIAVVSVNNFRVGIEFIDLQDEHASFIVGLNSSKLYG